VEIQEWIDATRRECLEGPTAWDGYVGQMTAKAASRARDTGRVVNIEVLETPDLYSKKKG